MDKEIFQKCFALAESAKNGKYDYRFIFTYYDDAAKRSIIKNLAIILGKEKLVELTGKRNVVFVKKVMIRLAWKKCYYVNIVTK